MKKLSTILFVSLLLCLSTEAKKVKFAVDMSSQIVSPNGVHITGDFQAIAGYPGGDWTANETVLTQEGVTSIYSIVLDLPAFAKYEYKFVNGDQFYEAEFVPVLSRVGYDFNDNRWIFVDSIANDTTFVGNIPFAENAPTGLTLIRFVVDMQSETVGNFGTHVAGNFQGFNASEIRLYSFGNDIYEIIRYLPAATYEYLFYSDSTASSVETVPGICSVNSHREFLLSQDTLLPTVCFSSCTACSTADVENQNDASFIKLYPNPGTDYSILSLNPDASRNSIVITDISGKAVLSKEVNGMNQTEIYKSEIGSGIFIVHVYSDKGFYSQKLILE